MAHQSLSYASYGKLDARETCQDFYKNSLWKLSHKINPASLCCVLAQLQCFTMEQVVVTPFINTIRSAPNLQGLMNRNIAHAGCLKSPSSSYYNTRNAKYSLEPSLAVHIDLECHGHFINQIFLLL